MTSQKHNRILGAASIGILIAAMLIALGLGGCAPRVKTVTDLPTGVSQQSVQQWDAAVANLHKIAATTSTIRKVMTQLHIDGVFPDEPYAKALRSIANVDILEGNAAHLLEQTPKTFGLTQKQFVDANMNAILGELRQAVPEGVLGIKNPDSQKQVNTLLAELTATVNLVLAL